MVYINTMAARIRFFTQTNSGWFAHYWSDIGREWLKAIAKHHDVRAITTTVLDLTSEDSPWHEVEQHFITPLAEDHVNIVCGFGGEFVTCYEQGKLNIAVTGLKPREPNAQELVALRKYNHRFWVEKNKPEDLIKLLHDKLR
jgi:hypothetical protein